MIPKHRSPVHPGEVLVEEFLTPMRISQIELARRMGVPVQRVNTCQPRPQSFLHERSRHHPSFG
jgi:hypothetical protein